MDPRGLVLIAAAAAATVHAELPAPRPGEPYPTHLLPSLSDGRPLSIAHFRGKKVLLLQFASW